MTDSRTQPNWLFRGLVIFSLLVHAVLFVHIASLYRPRSLSYLELTMRSVAKPAAREIPRPRLRPPTKSQTEKAPLPTEQPLRAHVEPPEVPRVESVPDIPRESMALPHTPVVKDLNVSAWSPVKEVEAPVETSVAAPSIVQPEITEADYRDNVDSKIRNSVQYPARAKKRNLQGRVIISVTIGAGGEITELKIIQSSGHRILDRSVLKAVKDSAPFSSPPDGPVTVIVPIQFQLI